MRSTTVLLAVLASCASAAPPVPVTPAREPERSRPVGSGASVDANGCPAAVAGITIEGQLGTLPQGVVDRVVREGTEAIARCFIERQASLPYLSGRVELKLRVGSDGAVRWAIPTSSTLGDRETERCMANRARSLRFSSPCGAEAEVTFPLDMEGGEDSRPATVWPSGRLDGAMREHRSAVAACRRQSSSAMNLTVYVSPEGRVSAMGGGVADEPSLGALDCLAREMALWRVPVPGSWYARTTLQIP